VKTDKVKREKDER